MKSTIKENITKGVSLIKESVKLYESGDYEKALELSGKGELMVSESVDRLSTDSGSAEAIYGDNINFGAVYHVFESNIGDMMKTQSDKIGKVLEAIKKDRVLLMEFNVYNAFTNPENVSDAKTYTDSVLSMMEVRDKNTLKESNGKLVRLMRKLKFNECVDIPDGDARLYESIEYVMTTKPSISKAAEYGNAVSFITECVSNRNAVIGDGVDKTYDGMMNDIAEKYHSILNDDEKEFISEVSAPDVDRKAIFESNRDWLIAELHKKISTDKDRSDEWKSVCEKVESKVFSEKTALADIAEMLEMKDVLSE